MSEPTPNTALRACAEAPEPDLMTYMTTTDPVERDAAFLRTYAEKIRNGTAATWEIPSTVAGTIEAIAERMKSRACAEAPATSGCQIVDHLNATSGAEAPATDTEPRAILPDALPSGASSELARWRGWAQCVYLGGGRVTTSDDALRAAVCAAHDADTYVLRAAGAVGRDGFAALVHRVMAYCTEQAGDDAAAFSALVARLLPPRPGGYPMTQADMEAPATDARKD